MLSKANENCFSETEVQPQFLVEPIYIKSVVYIKPNTIKSYFNITSPAAATPNIFKERPPKKLF
jgi:hypothetical protein